MNAHAPIAPSGLDLTVACPGSVALQASVPPQPITEEEAEGTAAHWVAMRYAAGYARELPIGAKFTLHGREWEVDADMAAGAELYRRAIEPITSTTRFEDPVRISYIHPTDCWGTPDAWRYEPSVTVPHILPTPIRLIRLWEYKYGHRYVEVYEMFQGAAYVRGIMELLNLSDNDPNLWFEIVLVQPRCYHREGPVRVWRATTDMLRATLNVARSAATEALTNRPRTSTNDRCIDCRARHVCKTLQHATHSFIDFSGSTEQVELPPEAIGQELAMVEDAIDRLEARRTGLSAQAETLLRQGKPIAFYHMAPGQARMIYKDDVQLEEVIGLGELLGINLRKPQTLKDTLVTPRQAIDLGIDPEVMKSYAHRPQAAFKLTRDNSITARKVFAK